MTAQDFLTWLGTSVPGERCIYHVGLLAADTHSSTGEVIDRDLVMMGREAWRAYEAGLVRLVQRRLGHARYEYIAERASSRKGRPA